LLSEFLSELLPSQSINMNATAPFPWSQAPPSENTSASFRAFFRHAPVAAARCNQQGLIVEMNPVFEQGVGPALTNVPLRIHDLGPEQDRDLTEKLLRDLLAAKRNSIRIAGKRVVGRADSAVPARAEHALQNVNWIGWRLPGNGGEANQVLLMQETTAALAPEEELLQTQKWEAVGRLAGGVVHDFNNLLTGVMLYCDLLLSSLNQRDRRRRYADEIRAAVMQATGLVRQLLVFARPQAAQAGLLNLNSVARAMQDLLTRLIGEHISLELHLDPGLGLVKMDQAQAQQLFLNLVLNARDALPQGGRVVVETSNCGFQPLPGSVAHSDGAAFPCVLLVVADNGRGMDAETRQRLFEPFFTTKTSGTGLGLTTVRGIVTTNRGLIHLESQPGRGTRAMILLPRESQTSEPDLLNTSFPRAALSATPFQGFKKESLL
jgi:signal transduction histidine kinase